MNIVLEGVDGSGKSTIHRMLQDKYPESLCIRDPGGSPVAEDIRKVLLYGQYELDGNSQTLLYTVARRSILKDLIDPYLQSTDNPLVILDRWLPSTLVYQSLNGVSQNEIYRLYDYYSVLDIDTVYYLKVSLEVSLERTGIRDTEDKDRFESLGQGFRQKVIDRYNYVMDDLGSFCKRVKFIDASLPVEDVFKAVYHDVRGQLDAI